MSSLSCTPGISLAGARQGAHHPLPFESTHRLRPDSRGVGRAECPAIACRAVPDPGKRWTVGGATPTGWQHTRSARNLYQPGQQLAGLAGQSHCHQGCRGQFQSHTPTDGSRAQSGCDTRPAGERPALFCHLMRHQGAHPVDRQERGTGSCARSCTIWHNRPPMSTSSSCRGL